VLAVAGLDGRQVVGRHEDLDGPDALQRQHEIRLALDRPARLVGQQELQDDGRQSLRTVIST
jgi:hypothetical protein